MTVLERLKAAGYDPAVSLFPDSIGNAGSMECERIQIRTFFCRPRENEAAAVVLEDYERTKKELADWVNASPEELADVIAGM